MRWIVPRGNNLQNTKTVAAMVDDREAFVSEDVGKGSGDGDATRAGEEAVGIEGEGALQEIVGRVSVEKSTDAGHFGFEIGITGDDEAFFAVRDVKKAVHQMDG